MLDLKGSNIISLNGASLFLSLRHIFYRCKLFKPPSKYNAIGTGSKMNTVSMFKIITTVAYSRQLSLVDYLWTLSAIVK